MSQRRIMGEVVEKLLRSASNGQRLHLDPEHARAIITSRVYPVLTEIQAEELQQLWREEPPKEPRSKGGKGRGKRTSSKSDSSGSGPGSTATTGASAGTIPEVVGPAASRQALAAAEKVIRQSRQSKRLRTIIPPTPARPSRSSPPRLVSQS